MAVQNQRKTVRKQVASQQVVYEEISEKTGRLKAGQHRMPLTALSLTGFSQAVA
jgi:hypothetical protein